MYAIKLTEVFISEDNIIRGLFDNFYLTLTFDNEFKDGWSAIYNTKEQALKFLDAEVNSYYKRIDDTYTLTEPYTYKARNDDGTIEQLSGIKIRNLNVVEYQF